MAEESRLGVESSAVQAYLSILQGVIERMAENSRSCKVWCSTLVAAILVLVARTENPDYVLIALLPAVAFLFLDAYYLALERAFRSSYEVFVGALHRGEAAESDLYHMTPGVSLLGRWQPVWCRSRSGRSTLRLSS